MLIVALVLAVVGLAALVTAVVTSNEMIAWVCIAASVVGVLLLIVDALRDRSTRDKSDGNHTDETAGRDTVVTYDEDYPEEAPVAATYGDVPAEDSPADVQPVRHSREEEPVHHDSFEETAIFTREHDPHGEASAEDAKG